MSVAGGICDLVDYRLALLDAANGLCARPDDLREFGKGSVANAGI